MASNPGTALVCFDIGGVLVKIRRTWQEAAQATGIRVALPGEPVGLSEFPLFDPYQMGAIPNGEYFADLGSFLGVSPADAKPIHDAILESPYPGAFEIVRKLNEMGSNTACLSNTNLPHWEVMSTSGQYPAIEALRYRMLSHEMKLLKPDPALFRLFDLETQTPADKVVFFDDHQLNVDAARNHGWTAFFIDHEADPAAQIRERLTELELLPRSV